MVAEKIITFGYRHGLPPKEAQEIDVRPLFRRNPYRRMDLRHLSGKDPEVAADIRLTPEFEQSYRILVEKVLRSKHSVVALGCTGGRHRSVYLAECLSIDLMLPAEHRDIDKFDFSNEKNPER